MKNGLTDKQHAFIEEYFIDFNATRAAQRAGYEGNLETLASVGCENLRKPHIRERIDQRMQARCMTANEVLSRLADQARMDIGRFLHDLGDGEYRLDLDEVTREGKSHLIKSVFQTRYGTRVDLHDSQRALELIGKHLGLFTERVDMTTAGRPIGLAFNQVVAEMAADGDKEDEPMAD